VCAGVVRQGVDGHRHFADTGELDDEGFEVFVDAVDDDVED
jgi:hypothetical protein